MTTAKTKRSVSLPILPPEIWVCIFDNATYVPGVLVPEIYDQSAIIGPLYNQKYNPALRAALVTKRCLVRVCKQWWHLASPYLYRSVYIGRTRCLSSLCSMLTRSAAGQGIMTGQKPLGFWTQRLDVAIRDHGTDFFAEIATLADVINCLPSLAVVSFSSSSSAYDISKMPATILTALRCSAATLRVLDLSPLFSPSPEELSELLRDCSHLRILNCHHFVWSPGVPLGAIIPNVTTLGLYGIQIPSASTVIAPQNGPISLRELILFMTYQEDQWSDFMRHNGSCLTALHLYGFGIRGPHHAMEYLRLVEETCSNLRRITLSLARFSVLRYDIHLPPIKYLGLRAENYLTPKSELQHLFSLLESLKTTAPSIRVVQLTDRHNVNCLLRSHPQVAVRGLKKLAGCTFRLEDHDGNLLEGSRLADICDNLYLILVADGYCLVR
ncbi:hypothetical protein F5I97DRAFT_1924662 [Phlebopus sp. FC_14]|nr:hypothetical protein F5I97DRAFT_1924662 [Phlebopus sp. FC_14]